jgi:ABC-type multidrug transport system fused ATPase/permease subunit
VVSWLLWFAVVHGLVSLLVSWKSDVCALLPLVTRAISSHAAFIHAGLRWSQRESYCQYIPNAADQPLHDPTKNFVDFTCIFPISQCLITLTIQAVAWMAIAIYLDNVMPNGSGKKRPLWYFLLPSYWVSSKTTSVRRLRRTESLSSDGARRTSWPGAGPSETNLRGSPALQQQQHDLQVQVIEGEAAAKAGPGMSGGRAVTASIHEGDEDVAAEAARMHALLKHRVATMGSKTAGLAKASARVQAMQATPIAAGAAGGVSDAAVDLSVKFAVEVYGLIKVFKGGARCCALPGCGPRKVKKGAIVAHTAAGAAAARKAAAAAARASGDFWAIKDSWFGIEEGQLFCLLGPNGAGKTTTINCLTGELV